MVAVTSAPKAKARVRLTTWLARLPARLAARFVWALALAAFFEACIATAVIITGFALSIVLFAAFAACAFAASRAEAVIRGALPPANQPKRPRLRAFAARFAPRALLFQRLVAESSAPRTPCPACCAPAQPPPPPTRSPHRPPTPPPPPATPLPTPP